MHLLNTSQSLSDSGKIEKDRSRILKFQTHQEKELSELVKEIETFAPEILGMQGFEIFGNMFDVDRAGWARKETGIPHLYVESVGAHCENVKSAAEAVIIGTPELVEKPEDFPLMGMVHDMPEGHRILPDITPHCPYTQEQKNTLEKYAVLHAEQILGKAGERETRLLREYIEQKTNDSHIMNYLDKIDAGVKGLDYEKLGFKEGVAEFHPYTLNKIADSYYFTNIYKIMLEREFKNLPSHFQYFMLLELGGNYDEWRYRINNL